MATQLDLAEAQLTGFTQARSNPNSIIELIKSIGLKKSEWVKIKEKDRLQIRPSDFDEIEDYFNR